MFQLYADMSREICVTSTVDQPVELPAGFDPTDPDVMQAGVPHQELLTLRRTAPVVVHRAAAGVARPASRTTPATGR